MDNIVTLFKLLSDKNRLRIMALLSKKKLCVCELACVIGVSQPSISRHIKKLKDAGLLQEEQDGFWTNYYLKYHDKRTGSLFEFIHSKIKREQLISDDLKKLSKVDRTTICKR